ncbi:hypothetical protein AURDEDRAFT_175130 [Auricularia subglabra TFB-10046 SS5]|nr:hypothetical protein AURDEDRAFT_175130 [Auricularia subglabra TFB-10046 SS5]
MPRASLMLLVLAAFVLSVSARILNVTIDDALGDERKGTVPLYAPAQPDGTQAYNGTWHDRSTFIQDPAPSTITLDFSGTRIYVFFILFNNIGTVNNNTRLQFYMDGLSDPTKEFLHLGDPAGEKYLYNQLVYDSQALKHGDHTLRVSSYSNGTDGSVALFDYAVYTTEIDDDPTPHTSPAAIALPAPSITQSAGPAPSPSEQGGQSSRVGVAIGGPISGALVAALLLAGASWFYIRRRQTSRKIPAAASSEIAGAAVGEDKAGPVVHPSPPQLTEELRRELVRHEVLVSNWADGGSGSLIYFDYALYTITETDASRPPGSAEPLDSLYALAGTLRQSGK